MVECSVESFCNQLAQMAQIKKKVTKKAGSKKKVIKKKVTKRAAKKVPAAKPAAKKAGVRRKEPAKKKVTKKKVTKRKVTKNQGASKKRKANVKWHAAFLVALAATGDVGQAAAVAGVARRTAYHHRESDKDFAAAWQETFETKIDELETSAMNRAISGLERHTYFKDMRLDTYRMFETSLTIFMLKKCRPERYADRAIEGGGLSPEESAAAIRDAVAAMFDSVPMAPDTDA